VLESLDAAAVRAWCVVGLEALRRHQREIDELNVYPVPDGDTGTNLALTFAAAHAAAAHAAQDAAGRDGAGEVAGRDVADGGPGEVLHRMARGAVLGARGNSGVILSQILGALATALTGTAKPGGRTVALALADAATAAYAAVAAPVEGTVLTVARAAAEAALAIDSDELASVLRAAAAGAAQALARTPEQLPALARAGVVDAGGRGLVVLLDALVEVVTGVAPPVTLTPAPPPLVVARESGSIEYAYEVQYLLDAPERAVQSLREVLARLGDSLVLVGTGWGSAGGVGGAGDKADADGRHTWNVHVHVNDVGAAIEAAVEVGRPHRIAVTRFADQVGSPAAPAGIAAGTAPTPEPAAAHRAGERGAVVVAAGPGLARLLGEEGAVVLSQPSPSTVEILDAVRRTGAAMVVILPNDRNVHAVASLAAEQARQEGIRAGVVPTRAPVQALAALAVRDPGRRFEDDLIAMADAAGACRYAEVTTAAREAVTVAGVCQPGDLLALVEGEVNLIGRNLVTTCTDLLDRLLAGGGELVTLLLGAGAPDGLADDLRAHLAKQWPFVEVQAFAGGQARSPLQVGVE
jgi:uncharacterized protein